MSISVTRRDQRLNNDVLINMQPTNANAKKQCSMGTVIASPLFESLNIIIHTTGF